jgi:hypothetical protein
MSTIVIQPPVIMAKKPSDLKGFPVKKIPGKVPRKAPPDTGNPADLRTKTGMVTEKLNCS